MRTSRKITAGAAAAAALALAVPAGAFAHPSVWTRTSIAAASGACVTGNERTNYAVTNHGYTMAFNETNCSTAGVATGYEGTSEGMLNYGRLNRDAQGSFAARGTLSLANYLTRGDTGVQPHATCRPSTGDDPSSPGGDVVNELWRTTGSSPAITAWQTASSNTAGGEPFYAYVPWQKTGAGLDDDDPAPWVAVILAKTGVNLSSLSTVTDFTNACTGIGGVYMPADTVSSTTASMNSGYAHVLTAPLEEEISTLGGEVSSLEGNVASLTGQRNSAQADLASLARRLTATLGSDSGAGTVAASSGVTVGISGPSDLPLRARLLIDRRAADRLGLRLATIGQATTKVGADGTGSVTVPISDAAKAKVAKLRQPLKVTVELRGSDRIAEKELTLTR